MQSELFARTHRRRIRRNGPLLDRGGLSFAGHEGGKGKGEAPEFVFPFLSHISFNAMLCCSLELQYESDEVAPANAK